MTGVGLGQSIGEAKNAATTAAKEAQSKLDGHTPAIIFAFSSIDYDQHKVVEGVREIFPDTPVMGGSAAGEITSWSTVFDGVNVMAIATDQIQFSMGIGYNVSTNSYGAAAEAAQDLLNNNNGTLPQLVITLFDGMSGDGEDLVRGVQSVLGENIPLIGGSAGDDYKFEQTFEYYKDQVVTDAAICIGLTGDFSYGFGIRHGWQPVGLPLTVTKADGVLLQEVDNKPALNIYEDYFG